MKKRFGFTLAEVLITLGIIGVVAAMTIPTLIQNTNAVRWQSQYKKTYASLTNAVEMAQAQFESDFGTIVRTNNAGNIQPNACNDPESDTLDRSDAENFQNNICAFMNATFSGVRYMGTVNAVYPAGNVPGQAQTGVAPANSRVYRTGDGAFIVVDQRLSGCTLNNADAQNPAASGGNYNAGGRCRAFIDVNGATPPNQATLVDNANNILTSIAPDNDEGQLTTRDIFPIVLYNGNVAPGSNAAALAMRRTR